MVTPLDWGTPIYVELALKIYAQVMTALVKRTSDMRELINRLPTWMHSQYLGWSPLRQC